MEPEDVLATSGASAQPESVGERLRRLRAERGLSQREIQAPGVSYAYVSRIEAGARRPSVRAIRLLARKLGVSPEYLETGVDLAAREGRELRLAEAELQLRVSGDLAAAEQVLWALAAEAEEERDQRHAARARAALGFAALERGDAAGAIVELERALDAVETGPLSSPDLYATLGRAYTAAGVPERAVEMYERCLSELEGSAENAVAYVRFATYLSYALSDSGELRRARTVLATALERAGDSDPYTQVRLYWAQARIAAAEGDPRTALANLQQAISLLSATEDTRNLARAHLLYAEILTLDHEAADAHSHLELAEQLLGARPDVEDLYWLRTEQARAAAGLGEAETAIARAREALALLKHADPAEQGAAYWALGEGLAGRGDVEEADTALREAVILLRGQHRWYEAAQAARSRGRILREAGREQEALGALEEAAELATHVGGRRARSSVRPSSA